MGRTAGRRRVSTVGTVGIVDGGEDLSERREGTSGAAQNRLASQEATGQARADAVAISNFMGEVFQSSDPGRDGRSVTVAETLDRAAKKLEKRS